MSSAPRSVFDAAADAYDRARPSYPDGLYEELERQTGRLAGKLVLDWGAGTGIASRQLAERGAQVISLDIGEQMLRRARARRHGSACVLATGSSMPVRSAAADLTTFAQSWHWFEQPAAAAEVARILAPGGWWAAWWNQATPDAGWWADYQRLLTASCPTYRRQHHSADQPPPDWSDPAVLAHGALTPAGRVRIGWIREIRAEHWLTDDQSKSYIISLEPAARERVLAEIAAIIGRQFPDGEMTVEYTTSLQLARKVS